MATPFLLSPAFPSQPPGNRHSLRFYETGAATADFGDSAFAFEHPFPKDSAEAEQGWSHSIRIRAVGADLSYSFDGTTVHGVVPAGATHYYEHRYEGGIAVSGVGSTFHIEAW